MEACFAGQSWVSAIEAALCLGAHSLVLLVRMENLERATCTPLCAAMVQYHRKNTYINMLGTALPYRRTGLCRELVEFLVSRSTGIVAAEAAHASVWPRLGFIAVTQSDVGDDKVRKKKQNPKTPIQWQSSLSLFAGSVWMARCVPAAVLERSKLQRLREEAAAAACAKKKLELEQERRKAREDAREDAERQRQATAQEKAERKKQAEAKAKVFRILCERAEAKKICENERERARRARQVEIEDKWEVQGVLDRLIVKIDFAAKREEALEQNIAKECEQALDRTVKILEQSEQQRFQLVDWVLYQSTNAEVAYKTLSTGWVWPILADLGWFRAPRGWAGKVGQADWLTPCHTFPGICTKGEQSRYFTGYVGSRHQGHCCDIEGNFLDDRLATCEAASAAYDYHPPCVLAAEHAAGTGQGPCLQSEDQVMQYLRQLYAPPEHSLTHDAQCDMWRRVCVGYGYPVVLAQMLQQLRIHARVGSRAGLRTHNHTFT